MGRKQKNRTSILRTLLFSILLFMVIWGSTLKGITLGGINFFPLRIVCFLWIFYAIFSFGRRKIDKFDVACLIFMGAAGLTTLWSVDLDTSLTGVLIYFVCIICFFISRRALSSKNSEKAFLYAVLINFFIVCIASVYESITRHYIKPPQYQYYLVNKNIFGLYMPTASFGNVNNLAMFVLMCIPFCFRSADLGRFKVILKSAVFSLGGLVILMTGCRTAIIGMLLILLYNFFRIIRRGNLVMRVLCVASIPVLLLVCLYLSNTIFTRLFAGDTTISNDSRWSLWAATIGSAAEYWFMGVGPGSAVSANFLFFNVIDPHNYLLELLCELGLIGFLSFAVLLIGAVPIKEKDKDLRDTKWLFLLTFLLTSLCVASMREYYIMWCFLGYCLTIHGSSHVEGRRCQNERVYFAFKPTSA